MKSTTGADETALSIAILVSVERRRKSEGENRPGHTRGSDAAGRGGGRRNNNAVLDNIFDPLRLSKVVLFFSLDESFARLTDNLEWIAR